MAKQIIFSSIFIVKFILLSYFANVCLSNNFDDNNFIELVSSCHQSDNFLVDSCFSSYPAKAIYQFGDSVSDTGNYIRIDPLMDCAHWPYGELMDKPTGRCSDGLLIIDFFAKFMNLPSIDPYMDKDSNFTHGVNFAVVGATTLNVSVLEEKYNISANHNLFLSAQLDWFKSHLRSFYPNALERRSKLSQALFIVGEMGGNDYSFGVFQEKTLQQVYEMVPDVVQTIRNTVEEIISVGATQIAIPGAFPLGCMAVILRLYKTDEASMYDELNCLKEYNLPTNYHNELLQQIIIDLRNIYPNVTIVYMDNTGAFREMLRHPTVFGFDEDTLDEACCESEDDSVSKVKKNIFTVTNEVSVCENSREYISWDGLHLTQHAYEVMAKQFIRPINSGARYSNSLCYFTIIIVSLLFI